ncbi:MAG: flagellar filament capping protein FliD [Candidatus Sericytochromatia bacterium]
MSDLRLSGLATGLDTRALITQLMAFERRPVNLMEQTQAKTRSKIDLYRQINTKLVSLQRASEKVLTASFNAAVAASVTSSDPTRATATADATAVSGTYAVNVLSLAQAQKTGNGAFNAPSLTATSSVPARITNVTATGAAPFGVTSTAVSRTRVFRAEVSTGGATASAAAAGAAQAGNVTITKGAATTTIAVTAGMTVADVRAAIDASGAGVTTSLSGSRLRLTGVDGEGFAITGDSAALRSWLGITSVTQNTTAQQARVRIGGVDRFSNDNVFTDAESGLTGVTFTVAATNTTGSTVTVTNRTGSLAITNTSAGTTTNVAITSAMTTAADVASAINAANTGMTAAVNGAGRLELTATATGVAYTVADAGGGDALASWLGISSAANPIQAATAASISLDGGPAITSPSNTFTGALTGVSIDALAVGTATLTVTAGSGGTAADAAQKQATLSALKDMVTAFNDTMTFIKSNSSYDSATKKAGALLGDSMAANLRAGLTRMFNEVVDDQSLYRTAHSVGIQLQRDGTLVLDEARLKQALEDDASALRALFTHEDGETWNDAYGVAIRANSLGASGSLVVGDGIANRLKAFVDTMVANASQYNTTDGTGRHARGTLLTRIDSAESAIKDLDRRIESYLNRLSKRQKTLEAKFAAMEKLVAMMRNQGNYMASQYMGLNQRP